jgi:signal transduction histidine kinase
MRTDVFRIVQEALTNISRHAESSLAYVRLSTTKGGLLLEIGDNGKGMDMTPSDSEQVQGLGMVGMRERARTHGGKIKVESETMKGTSISVYFSQTTKP